MLGVAEKLSKGGAKKGRMITENGERVVEKGRSESRTWEKEKTIEENPIKLAKQWESKGNIRRQNFQSSV